MPRANSAALRAKREEKAAADRNGAASSIVSRSLAEIAATKVEWIWPGWVPAGMLSILDGDPSDGKSLITIDIAARYTRGRQMRFSNAQPARPRGVLFLAAEDSAEHTIKPRAIAADADPKLCRVSETIRIGEHERPIRLPEDIQALEREIVKWDIGLLPIDPILGFLSQAIDSHKDQSVRDVTHQLKLLAGRTGCAILGLRHLSKAGAGGNALYRGMGSIAITASARSAFTVGSHPTDSTLRVMASTKLNISRQPRSIAYRILEERGEPVILWDHECDLTAKDIGAPISRNEDGALNRAAELIREMLAGGATPLKTDIEAEAKARGIGDSTLNRAKKSLGVIPKKRGYAGAWVWTLPVEGSQPLPGLEDGQEIPD